jgi:hypothetical protein
MSGSDSKTAVEIRSRRGAPPKADPRSRPSYPASARFPASVIRIRTRPPARVLSASAFANPARNKPASSTTPKRCAQKRDVFITWSALDRIEAKSSDGRTHSYAPLSEVAAAAGTVKNFC